MDQIYIDKLTWWKKFNQNWE